MVRLRLIKNFSRWLKGGQMDLTFIPVDELINEVCKRFDCIAITAQKYTDSNGNFVQLRR